MVTVVIAGVQVVVAQRRVPQLAVVLKHRHELTISYPEIPCPLRGSRVSASEIVDPDDAHLRSRRPLLSWGVWWYAVLETEGDWSQSEKTLEMGPSDEDLKASVDDEHLEQPYGRPLPSKRVKLHADAAGVVEVAAHHGAQTAYRWWPHGARPAVDSIDKQANRTFPEICCDHETSSRWNNRDMDPPALRLSP